MAKDEDDFIAVGRADGHEGKFVLATVDLVGGRIVRLSEPMTEEAARRHLHEAGISPESIDSRFALAKRHAPV